MSLLSPTDQQTLRDMFADMTHPVTILFFTQTFGCETCDETKRILAELTDLTDRIVVEEINLVLDKERAATYGIDRAPGLVLLADGKDTRVRFLGAPLGYDFMAVVDAVLAVSGATDAPLTAESIELLAAHTRAGGNLGLRHADLRLLPPGGGARGAHGVCQPPDHGDHDCRHGVPRPGAPVPGHRGPEDRRQRQRRDHGRAAGGAVCPRRTGHRSG